LGIVVERNQNWARISPKHQIDGVPHQGGDIIGWGDGHRPLADEACTFLVRERLQLEAARARRNGVNRQDEHRDGVGTSFSDPGKGHCEARTRGDGDCSRLA
jgi:hypothetical protein